MWPTEKEIEELAAAVKTYVKKTIKYHLVACECRSLYCIQYSLGDQTNVIKKCEGCIKKLKPH